MFIYDRDFTFWIDLIDDKKFVSTEHEFGEISKNDSGSSTSLRYTKRLTLISYIGANIKGRVFTNDGEFAI